MDSLEKMSKDEETKLGLFRSILSLLSYDRIVVHGMWDDIYIYIYCSKFVSSVQGQMWPKL